MIPSILARQIEQGIKDFLATTFSVTTPFFHGLMERFFEEESVFKGPYVSLQLPFRSGQIGQDYFSNIPLPFKPYLHQEKAFERLSSPSPESTLIATGTGSGKTECFLYPILDYCYQHRNEPGIKAILIYPMNALATDQAGRLARIIWNNPNLQGKIQAGVYIGQADKSPYQRMTEDHLITDKETLGLNPPDILLTNYKMLDYLLIRPKDASLWQNNGPETLRYLVVDELHTFDGAQGTDLACLIRRLKARLKTPPDYLCCVGTSATLGSDQDAFKLLEYARQVFGEDFDDHALITESRVSAGEFLGDTVISRVDVVSLNKKRLLKPENYQDYSDYIRKQYELWFDHKLSDSEFMSDEWRIRLGRELKGHLFFQNLIKVLRGNVLSFADILRRMEKYPPEIESNDKTYKADLLMSLLALVSEARKVRDNGSIGPFLHVRVQLWIRELGRMVVEIARPPRLRFSDDLTEEQRKKHLPVVHCRECEAMGWVACKSIYDNALSTDLKEIYVEFFRKSSNRIIYLFPEEQDILELGLKGYLALLCPSCLHLNPVNKTSQCPGCKSENCIKVYVPETNTRHCPYCGAHNSLTLLGSRAASLTSVSINQLFASKFNSDKKLLAFSDNVQDAAHRAGYFAARTYRFNLRTAIQQLVNQEGSGLSLVELAEKFPEFWLKRMSREEYIATFLAPNMEWLQDYEFLKDTGKLPERSRLLEFVNKRIEWEIFAEYGFDARIGRTLEKTGSSTVYISSQLLSGIKKAILEKIHNEIDSLREITELELSRFLAGFFVHLKRVACKK